MNSSDLATDYTVAVDIGGTFTDISLLNRVTGQRWRAKTPSVPSDPSEAFLRGITIALEQAGAPAAALGRVLHGTTVATNMILEGKGAPIAFLTTEGFRHVLAIGRQDIPRKANLYTWVKPKPPVPASRIFEVRERLAPGGDVLVALDEETVVAAARAIAKLPVQAVGVSLLHAFANPAHERRVAEILREHLPDLYITISSDVLPVVREYERGLTTVLNASVMPGVTTYIARLEDRLTSANAPAPLMLMQSNGGIAGAAKIRTAPALTALSGPAAGVVGARVMAEACGIRDIITCDIGGTSADICLIKDGHIGLTQSGAVGDWPLALPIVDMITIGAGGGSIAKVDAGRLSVGPQSAGARPGPAGYGHGGTLPTVTDAHIVLGHLPASLLGGTMHLDREAAQRVIRDSVATPLGLSMEQAARGILTIADNNMVGAMRVISVERGHDPRSFALVPFGGAGPLHGCSLAETLGTDTVVIPPSPGVLCADGLMVADLKSEFSRALGRPGAVDPAECDPIIAELSAQADAWFATENVAPDLRNARTVALMRFKGQGGEIAVPYTSDGKVTEAAFIAAHTEMYGFALQAPVELVTLRVECTGTTIQPPESLLPAGTEVPVDQLSPVWIDGAEVQVPVISRTRLGAGAVFDGPAILTQLDTTTYVKPGWRGTVDASGALILRKA
ncbi:hydantoin utilization protein (plasmid) [Ketogulonicigenium vulgare Y25]|uniref:5-oxoprolinase (ATP-hydrolyzing) n=1 Tax=Ketogulonicigenium vulgare (strain WSH-001) TaxID=759362 RepID=F9YBS6_KETVW|nr:hydantoinase/oxoprolinase family protein [Ketogulonicigenium vulgare]ADO44394.1 hydantoin utilization protein [Ketogulonicigenium vulgare Y25]AEM42828.1 5-oxoprolinase (ATP-hydrolyzing) [Ketogulonicigenium vulgare WSH-001]ALJ82743.1 5-oxoprolinase [Ketogulonicigenium vulgare]